MEEENVRHEDKHEFIDKINGDEVNKRRKAELFFRCAVAEIKVVNHASKACS